ncbi:OsmC family protein [Salipiger pacificus]|nr:OsmC family protein [Alloyangia pacifica]MCA0946175.1 OsmC family protein [Alloyangia pacifica]
MTRQTNSPADRHARDAQLRVLSVFSKRPEVAQSVNRGTAEVTDGLGCVYAQDGHRLAIDMPAAVGGSETGPTPGFFGRAAICGCVAIGIKMTALREGLQLDAVRVDITQRWDDRGLFGMAGANAGPLDTGLAIEIVSAEPAELIEAMVARALACDPWFLAFREAQVVRTKVTVAEAAL